jgi:hypothetical protein
VNRSAFFPDGKLGKLVGLNSPRFALDFHPVFLGFSARKMGTKESRARERVSTVARKKSGHWYLGGNIGIH